MGKLAILAAVERLPRVRQQGSPDLVHESMELSGQMTEQQLNGSSNICCDGTKVSSSSDKCQQRPTLPSKPQPAANTQRTNASSKTAAGNKKPLKRSICHEVRQGVPEAYDRHGGRSASSGAGAPQRNDQEIPAPHRASATRETSPSQEINYIPRPAPARSTYNPRSTGCRAGYRADLQCTRFRNNMPVLLMMYLDGVVVAVGANG
ncbi:uncharacterized protein [Lolium perenne]|uniref:uncharacterized protein isoform X1 n=2 Tax=Lolium perenne TaxID=4522 RepID=UPI003A9A2445